MWMDLLSKTCIYDLFYTKIGNDNDFLDNYEHNKYVSFYKFMNLTAEEDMNFFLSHTETI